MNEEELQDVLNTIHVPNDAEEHADGLRRILERIPKNWGRWISCDKGWYPLIIELDQKLAEIFPEYELHQVKEKFGTLRYYIGFPQLDPQCCIDIDAQRPHEGPVDPKWRRSSKEEWTAEQQYTLDKWYYESYLSHLDGEDHATQNAALDPERQRRRELGEKMHDVINTYEELSAKTCELCGAEAEMMSRGYWYKTLCPQCAEENNYFIPSDQEEDD